MQIVWKPQTEGNFYIVRQRLEILPGNLVESKAICYLADAMHKVPCISKPSMTGGDA
jgi:hypothetical protein